MSVTQSVSTSLLMRRLESAQKDCMDQRQAAAAILLQDARAEIARLTVQPSKLKFIGADGRPGTSPAQGTCLMAAGRRALEPLHRAQAEGLGVLLTRPQRGTP